MNRTSVEAPLADIEHSRLAAGIITGRAADPGSSQRSAFRAVPVP